MKVFAISLVKNEEDIIAHNLAAASEWAEKIFVMDNGSEDRTWEIVQEVAAANPKVIAWKKEAKPFRDEIRGEIFNEFRHYAEDGDWWCFRLDADEFYIDDPRDFLAQIPEKYHVVYNDSIEYQITHQDIEDYEFTGKVPHDLKFIQYHLPTTWSERRFFRHRKRLEWPANYTLPKHAGITYPKKIRLRHYQYRSPQQIQARLKTRRQATAEGYTYFGHSNQENWQDKLYDRKDLSRAPSGSEAWDIRGCRNNHLRAGRLDPLKKLLHQLGIFP